MVTDRDRYLDAGIHEPEVGGGVGVEVLRLFAVHDLLSEEPPVVEEADGAERQAQVAGGLQVVACEDPQSTGILGN